MEGQIITQTEAMINHYFPSVDTDDLDLDGVIEWGRKAIYLEEREKMNMQRAIAAVFGEE